MELGVPLLIVEVVLFGVGLYLRRARAADPRRAEAETAKRSRRGVPEPAEPELDLSGPRPRVVGVEIDGPKAIVTFDVPMPDSDDEILAELLVAEAVEVLRERRHTTPISGVETVVAHAGRPLPSEVGRTNFPAPGQLPPPSDAPSILSLSTIAADPLSAEFDSGPDGPSGAESSSRGDTLGPIASELRLPKAIQTGLRAQGIDPASMHAADLVTGTLALVGYNVSEGPVDGTWYAEKGGSRTFIREVAHNADDYPELEDSDINSFLFEFQSSGADRGLLVTDKFSPFSVYDKERREPRVRFLSRERLQKVVDSLALG